MNRRRTYTYLSSTQTATRTPVYSPVQLTLEENFEIVSLVGTLQGSGECHLHISLADKDGKVIGGHVVGGCEIFTTAEIVLGAMSGFCFDRVFDDRTGFKELVVNYDRREQ